MRFKAFWIVALLVGIGFWSCIGYVAHHFIAKYW